MNPYRYQGRPNPKPIRTPHRLTRFSHPFRTPPPLRTALSQSAVTQNKLTKLDLVEYAASGCVPSSDFVIGTEHEKFGFISKTHNRMEYSHVRELLNKIGARYKWNPIMEGANIIGLKKGGQSITLEPGGQFELSGDMLKTVHQTCEEVNTHMYQVRSVAEECGVEFVGLGIDPVSRHEDVPRMPKGRYNIMTNYMPKVGSRGLEMMYLSCTIQVNLDYSSEADMIQKFRTSLSLQPIANALFACSPFKDGKPNGYLSYRGHVWHDVDNDRAGMLPFVFQPGFGFEKYVDYALSVPMYFVARNGEYIDASGLSFRDFMDGKLAVLPGEYPTIDDWENHVSCIFPEVRMKKWLEMRAADGGPWNMVCSLPAFWVGLLYDDEALRQASDFVADWSEEEREQLWRQVPVTGLKTEFRGGTIRDVAMEVLRMSRGGLERRGLGEESFLEKLDDICERNESLAEGLLNKWNGEWGQDMTKVFSEMNL